MAKTGFLFDPTELKAKGCARCTLRDTPIVPHQIVRSPLMFVGESPGDVEIERGIPFCGPAGLQLDRYLKLCNIPRNKVSIANVVRCCPKRGHQYREPTQLEVQSCSLYLHEAIEQAQPRVIVALGNAAVTALLGQQRVGISKLRGRVFWYQDQPIYVLATFHPSYLIRQSSGAFSSRRDGSLFKQDLLKARRLCKQDFEDFRNNVVIANDERLAGIALRSILKQKMTAVDVEGYRPRNLQTVAFSSNTGTGAVVIPVLHRESNLIKNGRLSESVYTLIRQILKKKSLEIVGQNFNDLDRALLEAFFDCRITSVYRDTMYGSYIDDSRSRIHSLGLIAARYANMGNYDWNLERWAEQQGRSRNDVMGDCESIPLSLLGLHNGLDVIATHLSCDAMWGQFSPKFKRLTRVLTAASRVTQEMEDTGIRFDMEYSNKLAKRYDAELAVLKNKLQMLVGERSFNPASPEQVSKYVFERLQLHTSVNFSKREQSMLKTDTEQWSTKEEILLRILQETEDSHGKRFLETQMEFRDKSKDKNTFVASLQEKVGSDQRIHVPVILHGSETGRAACTLHNVKKTQNEEKTRYTLLDQLVASPGYRLVRGDYKQIELRMAAELSQDQAFLDVFRRGADPHHETAAFIFQLSEGESETSPQRTIAKNANFGSLFGLKEDELYDYLCTKIPGFSVPSGEVREFHRSFYRRHQKFRQWQMQMIKFARKHGYVEGLFGRRRHLNPDQGRHFENQAVNSPIQGSAHDLLLLAMIQLYNLPDRDFRILLDHHDALWLEVPEVTLFLNLIRIRECMEHPNTEKWYRYKMSIPTPIDLEIGKSMGNMRPVELT